VAREETIVPGLATGEDYRRGAARRSGTDVICLTMSVRPVHPKRAPQERVSRPTPVG
jgi:hypothetical protein